jgi:hypothetical protein
MTVSLKHTFQSVKADGTDATLVQPSNWNQEHDLTLATNKVLGRATAGTGAAEELSIGTALSISGGTLAVTTVPVANGGTGLNTLTTNNVLLGNGTSAVQFVAPSTTGNVLTSNGTTWTSAAPSANIADIQTFTASGTWTKSVGAQFVLVECWGAGGGGGSGRRGAAASGRSGGGGGGGGSYTYEIFAASALGATETVTIGANGTGGASVTANSTDGNPGTSGGNTTFGTKLSAYGGFGGDGGDAFNGFGGEGGSTLAAGTQVGTFSAEYAFNGAGGGRGDDNADANNAPCAFIGGAGGGGGGGANSSNAVFDGGDGGSQTGLTGGGGAGSAGSSTSVSDGGDGVTFGFGGGGAGGIHRTTLSSSASGNGGDGGIAAGGGGGGNGVNDFVNSGRGGDGGDGYCRVYTW